MITEMVSLVALASLMNQPLCFRVWERGHAAVPTALSEVPADADHLLVFGSNVTDVSDPHSTPYSSEYRGNWEVLLESSHGAVLQSYSFTDLKLGQRSGTVDRDYGGVISLRQFDTQITGGNNVGWATIPGLAEQFYFQVNCH